MPHDVRKRNNSWKGRIAPALVKAGVEKTAFIEKVDRGGASPGKERAGSAQRERKKVIRKVKKEVKRVYDQGFEPDSDGSNLSATMRTTALNVNNSNFGYDTQMALNLQMSGTGVPAQEGGGGRISKMSRGSEGLSSD